MHSLPDLKEVGSWETSWYCLLSTNAVHESVYFIHLQAVIGWEGITFTLLKATCNMQKAIEYAICQPWLVDAVTFNRYICQKRYFSLVDIWEVRGLSLAY